MTATNNGLTSSPATVTYSDYIKPITVTTLEDTPISSINVAPTIYSGWDTIVLKNGAGDVILAIDDFKTAQTAVETATDAYQRYYNAALESMAMINTPASMLNPAYAAMLMGAPLLGDGTPGGVILQSYIDAESALTAANATLEAERAAMTYTTTNGGILQRLDNTIIKYTPDEHWFGTEEIFTYNGSMDSGETGPSETITINVTSVDDAPVLSDITISPEDGITTYTVNLLLDTDDVDNPDLTNVSYSGLRVMTVNTLNSTFVTPDTSSWTPFPNWYYFGDHNISLGGDTFTLGDNTYTSIWAGGNGRIVFNSGADPSESISEFLAQDMICAVWDIELPSGPDGPWGMNWPGIDAAFWKIENNQFKLYADSEEYYAAAPRQYIITLNLDSHSEPGKVSFEYGTMEFSNGQVSLNQYWWDGDKENPMPRDGIIGISYGTNNIETLTTSNIDYLDPPTNNSFAFNQPIMQQMLGSNTPGEGTDQLANKKITFTPITVVTGASISNNTLTLDSTTISEKTFEIYPRNNGLTGEPATVTWGGPIVLPEDSTRVLTLFSTRYTNVIGGLNSNPARKQGTIVENPTADGYLKYSKLTYQPKTFNPTDISIYTHLHIEFKAGTNMTFYEITLQSSINDQHQYNLTSEIVADQWVSVDIPLTEFSDNGVDLTSVSEFLTQGNDSITFNSIFFIEY